MALSVRPLGAADLEPLAALCREAGAGDDEREALRERVGRAGFCVLGAFDGERLAGACSVGERGRARVIGPLQISAKPWTAAASALLAAAIEQSAPDQVLLTEMPAEQSPLITTHVLQKHGFWPRHFVAHLSVAIGSGGSTLPAEWTVERASAPGGLDAFLDQVQPGLRLPELAARPAGEVLLVRREGEALSALALCRRREGAPVLSVRFAAVLPSPGAAERFDGLLTACAALGSSAGARKLRMAIDAGCGECHTLLRARGFRNVAHGFAFHRPDDPFSCRLGVFAADDWR